MTSTEGTMGRVVPAAELVCHCRRVTYSEVADALESGGARTLADIQRQTTACTRCFGCRFELERLRREHLGAAYEATDIVSLPPAQAPAGTKARQRSRLGHLSPKVPAKYVLETPVARMYMPVLQGFAGSEVSSRAVFFNWPDMKTPADAPPVPMRVDLLGLDGRRLAVWQGEVATRCSAIIEVADLAAEQGLPGGVGVLKAVIDRERVGSLRPYFHFETPTAISSTHEKKAPRKQSTTRGYYWVFQIAASPVGEEAYFFCTNAQTIPLDDHALVWQGDDGTRRRIALPHLDLDQSACIALHEHVPAILAGSVSGTVRLDPPAHVAGWQVRYDRRGDRWRVQHL
ncbi:MAG: (2Fe-2S)-binding protein [Solirubrobacterales bacterium]|nr:(2Fe-2S)-binding protein [Solirubrobacterales bacterium]